MFQDATSKLSKIVTSKPLLVALLSIVFCLLIYLFGGRFNIGVFYPFRDEEMRLYAIIVIISIAVIIELYYLFNFIKERRANNNDGDEEKNTEEKSEPVISEYIKKQEEQFNRLFDLLKNNWKGKGFISGDAMYATPWYLVLGKSESGKTSFVNQSSLQYLMEDQLLDINNDDDSNGNKKELFRWKISNDAVVVEAKGDLFFSNRIDGNYHKEEVWNHFLSWLLKVRTSRPLNGLIITIDVEDLIHASALERDEYADNLKNKVRYFNENLGIRLPVYLIVSKIDLLEGFTEFFKDVSSDIRDQILGFSFPLEKNSSSYWKQAFNEQYDDFISLLNHHLVRRVGLEDNRHDSQSVYSFVRQLIGLKEILFDFMVQVFEEDRYSTFPLVRGLYFTSVYQQSVPINAIAEGATRRYSLPEVICSSRKGLSRPHFSKYLFHKIILPEVGIAGDNFHADKERKRQHRKAFVLSGLLVGLMTTSWFYYFQLNRQSVRDVYQGLKTYETLRNSISTSAKPDDYLESLNTLRKAVEKYQSYDEHIPLFSHMGLYRGHVIAPKVDDAYKGLLANGFLPSLAIALLESLKSQKSRSAEAISNGKVSNKDIEDLRIVRLLVESPKNKSEEELESLLNYKKQLVVPWFESSWQRDFSGDGEKQKNLQKHLNYALNHVGANLARIERGHLKDIQTEIGQIPLANRLYMHIKTEANRVLTSPLNLRYEAGGSFDKVFGLLGSERLDISIPQLFTYDGFHQFYIKEHHDLLSKASIDAWALGKRATTDSFSKADIRKLKSQVNELYLTEYKQYWLSALNELVMLEFGRDMGKAIKLLDALNDADNPYRSILSSLKMNTTLYTVEEPADTAEKKERKKIKISTKELAKNDLAKNKKELSFLSEADKKSLKFDIGIPLAKSFAPWNGLIADKKEKTKAKAYLEDIEFAFVNVYDYMIDIQQQSNGSNGAPYALQKVIDRLSLKAEDDPLYSLERIANGMKEPLRSHFKKIVKESWLVILELAANDLDRLWKDDVYDFFQENIEGRYPLVKTKKEVSFRHFQEFFSKEGKLQVFYDKYFKILLEDNIKQIYNPEEGILLISPNVLKTLEHAKLIREGFFSSKGGYKVEFSIEPIDLSASYLSAVLNIDGVPIPYNHGKSLLKDMIWPNQIESSHRSSISLNPIGRNLNQEVIVKEGAWSWFRLLDTAINNALSGKTREFRFNFRGGHASYRLKVLDNINPLTRDLFLDFSLPQDLKPKLSNKEKNGNINDKLEGDSSKLKDVKRI